MWNRSREGGVASLTRLHVEQTLEDHPNTTKGTVMRTLAAAAVALALAASSLVLAQTTPSPPTTPAPGGSMQPQWYSHQAGEMRASKLIGTSVNNDANERIGDVNEIVLGKDGKVAAVVIGVGGFLGMGEREVAVKFESLRVTQDANNNTVAVLSATKDSLRTAPEWRWSGERGSNTTGKGTPPAK
jgi:sporulation protein YlmC with PRC-barrel domain